MFTLSQNLSLSAKKKHTHESAKNLFFFYYSPISSAVVHGTSVSSVPLLKRE